MCSYLYYTWAILALKCPSKQVEKAFEVKIRTALALKYGLQKV